MTRKISDEQIASFNELLEQRTRLGKDEMIRRSAEFDSLADQGMISEDDPLYIKMKMVGAHVLAIRGDFPAALEALMKVLALATRLKQRTWELRCMNNIALVKQSLGDVFAAIEIWEELLEEDLELADRVLYTNNLGVAYKQVMKPKEAISAYFSALELLGDDLSDSVAADIYNNLGNIHRSTKQYKRAIDYFDRALLLYQSAQDNQRIAMIHNNLCAAYNECQALDKAREHGEIALKMYQEYMPEHTLSTILNNLAANSCMKRDFPKAIALHRQSLDLATKYKDKSLQIHSYNNLALIALYEEDYDAALDLARKSRQLAHENRETSSEIKALSLIKDAWHGKRDFTQAYLAQCLEIELERQTDSGEAALEIAQREAQHLQKRLEAQLDIYRTQNLALENQNETISFQTNELKTRNNLLLTTNALLNRIISIIAHDLRAPVASIASATQLLSQDMPPQDMRDLIGILDDSAHATTDLIDELLELATKYKSGMEDTTQQFDLSLVVRDSIKLAQLNATPKGIKISYDAGDKPCIIHSSPDRFRLILRNLLSNAIKFSHQDSEVKLSLEVDQDKLVLSVQDQGVGMDEQQVAKILAGASYSKPGTQHEKGFGMGLVFVLEAVIFTHGSLDIISSVGQGSRFVLSYQMEDLKNAGASSQHPSK